MRRRIRTVWAKASVAIATIAIGLGLAADPAEAQIPDEFTNLQVLPEDIGPRQILGYMRAFSQGLGVRCTYCHVGEEGQPFSEMDFASDDIEAKRKARFMLEMTQTLNGDVLPGITEVASRVDPPAQVQCVTCHRGVAVPRQIGDEISIAAADGGADAAVARYRELREEYYGSGSYDFGEQPMIETGSSLAESDPDAALAMFRLALEFYPESVQAWVGQAQVHLARDETDEARAALVRAQELAPDNPQIRRMLQQLDGGS
ncbi:MAG: c-type cytochrome [Gemmatimonadota bacterium]|nr:c-type cytochrome [Gemmatimonadota bacterium]